MSKGWDTTALKKLKSLIGKGLSTSEIGRRLGMSKNAVVGKLNRLGWNAKAGGVVATGADVKTATKKIEKANKSEKKSADKNAITKIAKKTAVKKDTVKPEKKQKQNKESSKIKPQNLDSKISEKSLAAHQRIVQHSLEMASLKPNQCRWPIGDPDSENFHFCGEAVFVGKPYCYEHCKQAYQFAPPKKTSVK